MKSVMTHSFSKVPKADIPRSTFDRSHGHKTTFDAGWLVPVYADEALPGDTFNLRMTAFSRLATPIHPIMDNLFMDVQFFAVPLRLVWDNFQKFMGEQTNPGDSTDFMVPYTYTAPITGATPMSLPDYFGIPPGQPDLEYTALFNRAYNLIYNEWYRDQNLQNSVVVDTDDGPDLHSDYALLRRGKRHDYFTSCLPWPQKGDAVSLPLGTSANILTSASDLVSGVQQGLIFNKAVDGGTPTVDRSIGMGNAGVLNVSTTVALGGANEAIYPSNLYADLSTATAATINQLRQAFQIQKLLERDARGGTRYIEVIKSHFGVTSPDARLQRPEFLGSGSTPINISTVPQTSSTDATTPQGNLAAFGTAVINNNGFTKSFTEHCVIIGLASVRADLTYQQGVNKMFSRSTRYDFYWPALSHIGEQAVLRKEIWATGVPANDDVVFGYQERYAEYRYKPSLISGLFRSDVAGTLDSWHLSQDFAAAPTLSAAFIVEDPPIDRVIAVPSEPHFIFDSYFKLICARPMPVYGVPGFIDHF